MSAESHATTLRAACSTWRRRLLASDLVRKIAETFVTRVGLVFLGLISSVLVARMLGPEGRGFYAVLTAICGTAVQFGNLGLHSANTYYVARDPRLLPRLIGNSLAVSLMLGSAIAAGTWFFLSLSEHYTFLSAALLALAVFYVPVNLAYLLLQSLLLGLQDVRTYNQVELFSKALSVTLLLFIVVAGTVSVAAVFAASLVSLGFGAAWILGRLLFKGALPSPPSLAAFTECLRYGLKAYLAAFFAFVLLRVDLLMVHWLLGAKQAGYYSIAVSLADLLYMLPAVAGTILFPKLTQLADDREKWAVTKKATWGITGVMLGLGIVAALLAQPIIRLAFGRDFLPASSAFVVLCGAMALYGPNNCISNYLASTGFPWFSVVVWLIAVLANVGFNLAFIPSYGIAGAAAASLLAYGFVLFAQLSYSSVQTRNIEVKRDFEQIYRTEKDPWNIGEAASERYDRYFALVLKHARLQESILDIGCGLGALLWRFRKDFRILKGVEVSGEAIARGTQRHPGMVFLQGSAASLAQTELDGSRFDFIVFSDVIAYLSEADKQSALCWIASHLSSDGTALIAAWCPGGNYLEPKELKTLVERDFAIEFEELLESQHQVFIARRKRHLVAVTVDYETWQPLPKGVSINWDKDVFEPARELMEVSQEHQVKLTLMAEMGEYFWLCANDPQIARKMEQQWRQAIRLGHDVQLHLHPNWLPELGAGIKDGQWHWDSTKASAHDYPGDLGELIKKCTSSLEALLTEDNPGYRTTSFRAGGYRAQPFRRLAQVLSANGIFCDSSVYAGGVSHERGYDYSLAYSDHQPYFANPCDPQLKAPPSEARVVELPIFTYLPGERWFLDNEEGGRFARRLIRYLDEEMRRRPTSESSRRKRWVRGKFSTLYGRMRRHRSLLNRILPRGLAHQLTAYEPERLAGNEYYVMIGHTKANLHFEAIRQNFNALAQDGRFEFVTLSEMARLAREELSASLRVTPEAEARCQVEREYDTVLGESRNEAQSFHLQDLIPLDREEVLDLGCGAGYWSDRIARLYPWMQVTGVDAGEDFIAQARAKFGSERVAFHVGNFSQLPFEGESFDGVYADNTLEHAFDVDDALREVHRLLRDGGVLVAAIPSDARNSKCICDNHTWKTAPHEVRMRLESAGFTNIEIEELDLFREMGMPPYPPSNDRMMYVRAWKRQAATTQLHRAREAMNWIYQRLSPEHSSSSNDARVILSQGHAFCWGYAVALGKLLQSEGCSVKWVSMIARHHTRGRGTEGIESHEVVAANLDGTEMLLDAMANTVLPYPLEQLLRRPELATPKAAPDARYRERSYHLYDTAEWYSRVHKVLVRSNVDGRAWGWRRNRNATAL